MGDDQTCLNLSSGAFFLRLIYLPNSIVEILYCGTV